jgi:hypothetical protein
MTRYLTPLLASLVLGLAACGGDDEESTGASQPAQTTEQASKAWA